MDFNLITNIESCHITVPTLLYYSHIPTAALALLIGFFVYFKNRKELINKILFSIAIVFSLWVMFSLITWLGYDSRMIMFVWSFFGILSSLLFILFVYFVYVFIDKKDISFGKKIIFGVLLLPVIFLSATKFNLEGFNNIDCEAVEASYYLSYYYFLGAISFIWILGLSFARYRKVDINLKKQIIYLAMGVEFFLLLFFLSGFFASYLTEIGYSNSFKLEQYGLFGMTFFMGMLAFMIVKFKTFNIKLLGTQALVILLVFLIGALLFYVQDTGGRILIAVNLLFALFFGWLLVKSVKIEVQQREALEVANKEITERKEELQKMADSLSITNEKLKIAYDKLEELDRAKADFIGLANHQLKHAPTTIKSFMSMLLDGDYGEVPESQIKVLKNVNDANDRQIRLADDLLQIIKMESNKVQLDFQKQSIEDVCQGVYDNLSAAAKERSLKLSYEKPEQALPEVLFDKNKVFEAIFNFVDNAIKYTKEGGITVKAEVSPSSNYKPQNSDDVDKKPIHGSVVRVVVSDTGSGISKEHLGQLFAKFSRKDTSNLNSGGTGLGLFLVKLMIEAHGGRTWAESDGEGKGSRFIMELPIETPKEILDQIGAKK